MKSNRIITIIFILVVALIIALAAYFINNKAKQANSDTNNVEDMHGIFQVRQRTEAFRQNPN